MPQSVPYFFIIRTVISVTVVRNSSSKRDLPDLIRSRSGYNESEGSTIPDTVSNSTQNNENINKANTFKELHDRAGLDTAFNPYLKKRVMDPDEKNIQALSSEFEKCKNKAEAQDLYDSTMDTLVSAHNAVDASNNLDLHDGLKVAKVKSGEGSNFNLLNSELISKHQEVKEDNKSHLDKLVSELNVSASCYSGYDSLEIKRSEEYYKELDENETSDYNASDDGSVEETTPSTPSRIKQDSSDIIQDTFDSSDYNDDF